MRSSRRHSFVKIACQEGARWSAGCSEKHHFGHKPAIISLPVPCLQVTILQQQQVLFMTSNKWAKGLCSGVGRAPCEKKREKSAFSKFFCSNFLCSSPPPPLLSSSLLPGQNSKIPREWKVGFRLLRVSLFINVIF